MASKAAQDVSSESIEELLSTVDKTMDRLKTLYEQYFLGMQKQAPGHLHSEVERKLRDLQQLNIRNTGLRYRLVTLQQKFGSYNSYWRRTLRQIENGTYIRNLSKIGRQAARTGAEIPEEILAAMPKRMRDQVLRDREQALAQARRRGGAGEEAGDAYPGAEGPSASHTPAGASRRADGAHLLSDDDGDMDFDAFFASLEPADSTEQTQPGAAAYVEPEPPRAAPPPAGPATHRAAMLGAAPARRSTGPIPTVPAPARQTGPIPTMPAGARQSGPIPKAPSQVTRPNPIAPGSAAARGPVPVESMSGPFPRAQTEQDPPAPTRPTPRPPARPTPRPMPQRPSRPAMSPPRPPPGMTDADVNALYAKYVQAKQMVGEKVGPDGRGKLLQTISSTAPKIMQQYKAKGVDFSVVVKDNQVIIRAKPKG